MKSFASPTIQVDDNTLHLSLPASMQQTLEMIENVKSLSSCAKIASSALLHACSALDGSIQHDGTDLKQGSDLLVDEEADIYAARLAVCELSGADFSIPKECKAFVPTERTKKKRSIRGFWSNDGPSEPGSLFQHYDEITQTNLQQCRKALGSTPQSWTSFSNNRQNAVVMCRAMRSEVDKDEQLEVGKILAQAAAASTESLKDAYEHINEIKAHFSELATAMPQFQHDLAAGNKEQQEYLQRFWTEIERVRNSLASVSEGFAGVSEQISGANDDVVDLRAAISKAASDSAAETNELARAAQQDFKELSTNVETVNEVMEYFAEHTIQLVINKLYTITGNMDVVNALMSKHHQDLTEFDKFNQRSRQLAIEQEKEYQASHKENLELLKQSKTAAEEMAASVTSGLGLLTAGFPDASEILKKGAAFVGYTSIYALITFGIWERYVGFSVLGNSLAALGTGLCKCLTYSIRA